MSCVNNEMVGHAFAYGREAEGSNFRTDGKTVWSYSTEIATEIDGVYYISSNNMSVTTAKHLSHVWRGLGYNRSNVFCTPAFARWSNIQLTHKFMIDAAIEEAQATLNHSIESNKRAKTKLNDLHSYAARREEKRF